MLECGGDESPEDVAQYETEYHQWVKKTEEEAQPTFDKLRQVLTKAGVAEEFIETECYTPRPEESVARAILETALDESFKAVVVGRSFFPWFWDVLRHHVGDELRRKAKTYGLTIRVVQ
jgi:protein tyrosine phosphatase (PTP) superfamily phosphohydrolase (DUF442 family)